MHGFVPPDPEGGVSELQFAVVYAPKLNKSGRNRKRFSANCVEIKTTIEEAHADADRQKNRYAAKVLGPSKSSEGQYIFYLIEWLISNTET
ncbi:MAG: hypothetical protein AB8B92_05565 [Gammaproteobacteria bacterium]